MFDALFVKKFLITFSKISFAVLKLNLYALYLNKGLGTAILRSVGAQFYGMLYIKLSKRLIKIILYLFKIGSIITCLSFYIVKYNLICL